MTDDLISAAAAERILNRSRATVSRMARDGRLTPIVTVPIYLFNRSEVERVAAERKSA